MTRKEETVARRLFHCARALGQAIDTDGEVPMSSAGLRYANGTVVYVPPEVVGHQLYVAPELARPGVTRDARTVCYEAAMCLRAHIEGEARLERRLLGIGPDTDTEPAWDAWLADDSRRVPRPTSTEYGGLDEVRDLLGSWTERDPQDRDVPADGWHALPKAVLACAPGANGPTQPPPERGGGLPRWLLRGSLLVALGVLLGVLVLLIAGVGGDDSKPPSPFEKARKAAAPLDVVLYDSEGARLASARKSIFQHERIDLPQAVLKEQRFSVGLAGREAQALLKSAKVWPPFWDPTEKLSAPGVYGPAVLEQASAGAAWTPVDLGKARPASPDTDGEGRLLFELAGARASTFATFKDYARKYGPSYRLLADLHLDGDVRLVARIVLDGGRTIDLTLATERPKPAPGDGRGVHKNPGPPDRNRPVGPAPMVPPPAPKPEPEPEPEPPAWGLLRVQVSFSDPGEVEPPKPKRVSKPEEETTRRFWFEHADIGKRQLTVRIPRSDPAGRLRRFHLWPRERWEKPSSITGCKVDPVVLDRAPRPVMAWLVQVEPHLTGHVDLRFPASEELSGSLQRDEPSHLLQRKESTKIEESTGFSGAQFLLASLRVALGGAAVSVEQIDVLMHVPPPMPEISLHVPEDDLSPFRVPVDQQHTPIDEQELLKQDTVQLRFTATGLAAEFCLPRVFMTQEVEGKGQIADFVTDTGDELPWLLKGGRRIEKTQRVRDVTMQKIDLSFVGEVSLDLKALRKLVAGGRHIVRGKAANQEEEAVLLARIGVPHSPHFIDVTALRKLLLPPPPAVPKIEMSFAGRGARARETWSVDPEKGHVLINDVGKGVDQVYLKFSIEGPRAERYVPLIFPPANWARGAEGKFFVSAKDTGPLGEGLPPLRQDGKLLAGDHPWKRLELDKQRGGGYAGTIVLQLEKLRRFVVDGEEILWEGPADEKQILLARIQDPRGPAFVDLTIPWKLLEPPKEEKKETLPPVDAPVVFLIKRHLDVRAPGELQYDDSRVAYLEAQQLVNAEIRFDLRLKADTEYRIWPPPYWGLEASTPPVADPSIRRLDADGTWTKVAKIAYALAQGGQTRDLRFSNVLPVATRDSIIAWVRGQGGGRKVYGDAAGKELVLARVEAPDKKVYELRVKLPE